MASEEPDRVSFMTVVVILVIGILIGFFGGRWIGQPPAAPAHAQSPAPQVTEIRCEPTPRDDNGSCSLHVQRAARDDCFRQCADTHRVMVGWDVSRDGAQCRCATVEYRYGGTP